MVCGLRRPRSLRSSLPAPLAALLLAGLASCHELAPGLLANRDLRFALEAGFIGTWGEGHDSTSGNGAPGPEKALLDAERPAFGGVSPILVRYPGNLV